MYVVPEQCLFRASTSPLLRVYRNGEGAVVANLHDNVPSALHALANAGGRRVATKVGCVL